MDTDIAGPLAELLNPRAFKLWLQRQAAAGRVFNPLATMPPSSPLGVYMEENAGAGFLEKITPEVMAEYQAGWSRWCETLHAIWMRDMAATGIVQIPAARCIEQLDEALGRTLEM